MGEDFSRQTRRFSAAILAYGKGKRRSMAVRAPAKAQRSGFRGERKKERSRAQLSAKPEAELAEFLLTKTAQTAFNGYEYGFLTHGPIIGVKYYLFA